METFILEAHAHHRCLDDFYMFKIVADDLNSATEKIKEWLENTKLDLPKNMYEIREVEPWIETESDDIFVISHDCWER